MLLYPRVHFLFRLRYTEIDARGQELGSTAFIYELYPIFHIISLSCVKVGAILVSNPRSGIAFRQIFVASIPKVEGIVEKSSRAVAEQRKLRMWLRVTSEGDSLTNSLFGNVKHGSFHNSESFQATTILHTIPYSTIVIPWI